MNVLQELSKHHSEWIRMAKNMGTQFPDDLVQEMYIRLNQYSTLDKILNNGKVNTMYVWLTMRNIYYTESKIPKHVQLNENIEIAEEEVNHEGDKRIFVKIESEIDSWEWYDKMLFNIYRNSGLSMRELVKETKISLSSINNTIQCCKKRLKENVGEDYDDYKNKDYELI